MTPKTILTLLLVSVAISVQAQREKVIELHLQKTPTVEAAKPMALRWRKQDDSSEFSKIYRPLKGKPNWNDLEIYEKIFDSPQALFYLHKSGQVTDEFYHNYFKAWGIDTVGYSADHVRVYMRMATGKDKDGKRLFVFDENGNDDLSDDKVIIKTDSMPVIPTRIERFTGGKVQNDTLWGKTIVLPSMYLWSAHEKTEARFMDENGEEWHVEVYPTMDNYGLEADIYIGKPGALFSYPVNGVVQVNDTRYRIDSLRPDGRYLRLTEEFTGKSFESLQKGFRLFSFVTRTIDGKTIRFPDDFQGKYVLLDFWATTCPPCIIEIKNHLIPTYELYKEHGFEIVSIADNMKEDIERFNQKIAMPWIQVVDGEQNRAVQKQYNIVKYPTLFLLDKTGSIIAIDSEIRGELLLKKLQELIPDVKIGNK